MNSNMHLRPLVVRRGDAVFTLQRIDDRQLVALGRTAVAVEEDPLFWMQSHSRRQRPQPLGMPQFFATMCRLFGDSSIAFDDYKQSFCFPFHMTTRKGARTGDYILMVEDWKGGRNARLYRRGEARSAAFTPILKFVDDEFSRDDYRYVASFLEGYVEGFEQTYRPPLADQVADFVHHVDCAFFIYGYQGGQPFEEHHEGDDAYTNALARRLEPSLTAGEDRP